MKEKIFNLLYIFCIAICFTTNFAGQVINYYLRVFIGFIWIIIWLFKEYKSKNKLVIHKLLPEYLLQWFLIPLWTCFIWTVNKPTGFDASYQSRMFSNTLYIIVAIVNAYAASRLFGEKAINMAFKSLLLIMSLNFIVVLFHYGLGSIIVYLQNVVIGEFQYESTLWQLANELEMQGPTMVMGVYLVYFLFLCNPERKQETYYEKKIRTISIILTIPFVYIGFKRTVIVACVVVIIMLLVIKQRRINVKDVINLVGAAMMILIIGYVIVAKFNFIAILSDRLNINTLGRVSIYAQVARLYELSPLYMGKGFCFVSKYMFDNTGFVAHSEAIRMYAEIGAIPCILWLYYNLIALPQKITHKFGTNSGKMILTITIYIFTTYLFENTLVLYPMQYTLALFVFISIFDYSKSKKTIEER